MSVKSKIKNEFVKDFQEKITQGRRLLHNGNHRWADKLFTQLYFSIEKLDWLNDQKKRQLITIISNSWWMYLNSLIQRQDEVINVDIIKYIDAYKRFFSFLSKLEDFEYYSNFASNLLRIFIRKENISSSGITKFINSFCVEAKRHNAFIKIIELQMVLMFLRKSVTPTDFFHFSMQLLGRTLFSIEPNKRGLFLYTFIETVNIKYELVENSRNFANIINKLLSNRLPSYLKSEFGNLGRVEINERNLDQNLEDLEKLAYYLNNIGENQWISIILKFNFATIKKFKSIDDAVIYISKFVEFAIKRNRFDIAFDVYNLLEDYYIMQTDLGYDSMLVELWIQACKQFVEMNEKSYLLQVIEKLGNHLKMPQTEAEIFHYFYTYNYLWQLKSQFLNLEPIDFWNMIFFRSLYLERDYALATKILPHLDKNIRIQLKNLDDLYQESLTIREHIYKLDEEGELRDMFDMNFIIKQLVIRIKPNGMIQYRMVSEDGKILEEKITNEYWNDDLISEIFNDIVSEGEEKTYRFSFNEFGKLLFLLLPKVLRSIFLQFKRTSRDFTPQVYFILDQMTVPFELLFDNDYFMLKYASSYKIGEPSLGGVHFGQNEDKFLESKDKFNILIIEATNSRNPLKWNDKAKNKEILYPFPAGEAEINHITEFFNSVQKVNQLAFATGIQSTKNKILELMLDTQYDVLHFVGNIFYSEQNPKNSYFITFDNEVITFSEIKEAIQYNTKNSNPFIFLNSQLFGLDGNKIYNTGKYYGEILGNLDYEKIIGVIVKNNPIFNEQVRKLMEKAYLNLFNNESLGNSLLMARQQWISNQNQDLNDENIISLSSLLSIGKSWKRFS